MLCSHCPTGNSSPNAVLQEYYSAVAQYMAEGGDGGPQQHYGGGGGGGRGMYDGRSGATLCKTQEPAAVRWPLPEPMCQVGQPQERARTTMQCISCRP